MEELRPLLITYAYNMIGLAEEAEDIVQDAFLKFAQLDQGPIINKKAYLIRMVINMSINRKRKLRSETVSYYGEWLPEPVGTDNADSRVVSKDVLSYSLMVLLEKLNARERAVFILKEAYDYEHTRIASVLNISVVLSRQLLVRAKKRLKTGTAPRQAWQAERPAGTLPQFMQAIRRADMQQLEQLLHDDIVVSTDGGGKAKASKNIIYGKPHAAMLLYGLYHKFWSGYRIETADINHAPALLYFENDDLVTCEICGYANESLSHVYIVRNPDKLRQLKKDIRVLSH